MRLPLLKSDRSFHKLSFIQPYYVSYLVVMIYRGGFVLARMEVCDKFWFVKVYLLSN